MKISLPTILILIFTLVFYFSTVFAISPDKFLTQYIHDVWTSNEGLPQDAIYSMVQTPDGYIWLATQEGIARFDGLKFTIFDSNNTVGMGNFVYVLFVDHLGILWIGTGDGLLKYNNGKFTQYGVKDGLPSAAIKSISEDTKGVLWLGAGSQKGLTRFEHNRGVILTTQDGLVSNTVNHLLNDRQGNLWIATDCGLSLYKNGQFTLYTTKDGLSDNIIQNIYEDRKGSLWVGTINGLSVFRDGKFTAYNIEDGLADNRIYSIYEDKDLNLWVGTEKGLNVFKNAEFNPADNVSGLADDRILSFMEDSEGSLWIGTHAKGLHRLRDGKFTPFGKPEGLLNNNVYGVYPDSLNRIWINNVGNGLNRLENNELSQFLVDGDLVESTVYEDGNGIFWFGTKKGLTKFEGGKFKTYSAREGLKMPVSSICQTRNGDLWIGSNDKLLVLRGESITELTEKDGFEGGRIHFIYEDRAGRLWISTDKGLTFYKDEKFTLLQENVPHDFNVQSISEDGDGTLWFGTWGQGLNRFKDGKLTTLTVKDGLYDNVAWSVLDDGAGNLWMGSNRGIFRVVKQELNDFADGKIQSVASVVYGTSDGMRERETNVGHPGAARARDGKFWFGTIAGVVMIDPKNIKINTVPPPIVFEQVLVDEQNFSPDLPLILAAGARNVEIRYIALSFIAPTKIKYRYKLSNFDEHWVDAENRREAFYTNLPAGDYEFQVIAANADGIWNEQGVRLKFSVLAPFWKTWWFLLLCLAIIAVTAYLLHRQRINQLEKRRLAQELFSRRLLASQEQERQRIAAELHDSIGQSLLIIKNRAFLALKDMDEPEIVREQLVELGESAAEVIEECREISYNLRPVHLKRFGLTKTLETIFSRISEVTAIETMLAVDSIDDLFSEETEANLYRIMQECVNNIIKHSQAQSAKLIIKHEDKSVRLLISDDGRGFDKTTDDFNQLPGIKKSGFGLIGMKERVRLIGGEIQIEFPTDGGTTIGIVLKISPINERN